MILSLWSMERRRDCGHLLVTVPWFKPVSEAAASIETCFPAG